MHLTTTVRAVDTFFSAASRAGTAQVSVTPLPRPIALNLERIGGTGRRLWFSGLPVSPGRDLAHVLEDAVEGDLQHTIRTLTTLDGAFVAFVWDPNLEHLVVVNDFAGMQPVYMRRVPGRLSIASTMRALSGGVPDPMGWGAFVGFGYFVGHRTSVADVTRLPAATVLDYAVSQDRLTTSEYWRWPATDPGATLDRVDTGGLLEIVDATLRSYEAYGGRGTLLLSGGFESRLLAALITRAGHRPTALTLRNPYEHLEIDGRFASLVAQELGLRHEIRDPDPRFFSTEKYLEFVVSHEVAWPSVDLFIAQIPSELHAAGVEASWDGFPFGSIIKAKGAPSFEEFVNPSLPAAGNSRWRAARQVFAPRFVDTMEEALHAAVRAEVEACHVTPGGVHQFFHRNRTRHRIAPNTTKVYASFLLPFLPGLAKALYEQVLVISPAARAHDALYHRIFERHFPALAALPFCSGGRLLPGAQVGFGYRALAARSAVVEHPRMGNLLRRFGLVPRRPEPAVVHDRVARAILDDPFVNADGIRALQRTAPSGTTMDRTAREFVFYWSMWKEVMQTPNR